MIRRLQAYFGLLGILFLLHPFPKLSAQDKQETDSLIAVLNTLPEDTSRIPVLINLWRSFAYNDVEKAKSYASQILELSSKADFKKGIATGHLRLGTSHGIDGFEDKAREEYLKALAIYRSPEINDSVQQAVLLFNIGLGYKSSGDYDSTLIYLERARKIFERKGSPRQKGAIYDGLSGVYYEQGDYDACIENALLAVEIFEEAGENIRLADSQHKIGQASSAIGNYSEALKYFKTSRKIYRENHDKQYEAFALKDIGFTYDHMDMEDSALHYYELLYEIAEEVGSKEMLAEALIAISGEYFDRKQYEKARPLFKEAIAASEEIGKTTILIPALENYGLLLYKTNEFAAAESYFLRAKELAQKGNYLHYQTSVEQELAVLYKNWNKPNQAIIHFFAHQDLKDSMLNLETNSKIAELQTLYESEKKDREIERQESEIQILQQEAEIDALNQKMLIGGILLSLLLMAAIYFAYRQKIQREQLIHEQEKKAYEQELLFQKKELATHTLHLVQKSDLLEELKGQLESTRKGSDDSKRELGQMIQLIKSDKIVEQDWQNFKSYFDRVHLNFEEKMRSLSEGLSQNEYRLAALMKMDLSTKEIAGVLNISPDSVHKSRYRLKKRLELEAEDNLRDFILRL
ncbi:MAG: tetratricopeptide repeat protein [Bacteroidia bacterium]|nr:tetratricopeptide repeat protein [Bacteroidia bacterium]